MHKIKLYWDKFWSWKYKYISIILLIFVLWVTFISPNNIYTQYRLYKELSELKKMKKFYETEIADNTEKIHLLKNDINYAEKFAREEYNFKRENEDIYLIIESSK